MRDIEAREHPEVRGANNGARREHDHPGCDVTGRRTDVIAGLGCPHDPHTGVGGVIVVETSRVLHHDDRVRALGNGGAGHDPDRLVRAYRDRRRAPGRKLADDAQYHRRLLRRAGRVGGPNGVAVHCGVGERRDRLRGDDIGGEHETGRVGDRDGPGRQRLDAGEDARLRVGKRDHTRIRGCTCASRPGACRPRRGPCQDVRVRARRWRAGSPTSDRCRDGLRRTTGRRRSDPRAAGRSRR